MCKRGRLLAALASASFVCSLAQGQINSPYSRFGLGDLYNSRNVVNRGMGNLATPYADYQSVNFINPASYSQLQTVTFDVGVEGENRRLQNPAKTQTDKSGYLLFNYVALGMPLKKDKKGFTRWGLALGLRPYSRVSYNLNVRERLSGIDSVQTFYRGTGGGYRAFIGTGFKIGNLRLGINGGFLFGQQNLVTERNFLNDSVFYLNGLSETRTAYNRFSIDAGFQYKLKLSKELAACIAANGFLGQSANATQNGIRQTYIRSATRGTDSIDVVERIAERSGTIELPMGYTVGLAFEKEGNWMLGGEYEAVNWSEFRFMGQAQPLANTNMLRVGGYFVPNSTDVKSYFKRVAYRAGFYTGKDMVVANGIQLPLWGITLGAGLPIRRYSVYSNQYTVMNLSVEFGRRGNAQVPVQESFFRIQAGISLSDLWFQKRRFD
jgi:hypothetical protein